MPTGEWLRKLDNRCITQTIHKLTCRAVAQRRRKGQSALAPARCQADLFFLPRRRKYFQTMQMGNCKSHPTTAATSAKLQVVTASTTSISLAEPMYSRVMKERQISPIGI